MNRGVEYIKKLRSLCLNARAHEVLRHTNLENFDTDVPNRASGDMKNPEWFRKVSTRILFVDTFFTLILFIILVRSGVNLIFLLAGFFIALLLTILYWNAQMQRYDALVKHPSFDHRDMKVLFVIFAVATTLILYYYAQELTLQSLLSFGGGLLTSMWLSYFQLIYWEKKNHKMIYLDKSYGTWKSYIILERE